VKQRSTATPRSSALTVSGRGWPLFEGISLASTLHILDVALKISKQSTND
jgi:hypothetical protein